MVDEIVDYSIDNKIPTILTDNENGLNNDEISRIKLVNIVLNKHSLGIALKINANGHVFIDDILAGSPIDNSGCFNVKKL